MRLRIAKITLVAVLLALPVLGWVAVAQAQSFHSGNNVTVPSGQTVNSTLFVAGRTIDIAGDVNGDVFCAGSNVTVSGRVRGDVICAGQNMTVNAQVTGDVRLAGQNVTLGGTVAGNATIGAQNFTQQSGSTVAGDMTLGGQDATLNGKTGLDLAGGVTTLAINGPVGRNVQADVTELRLEGGANIAGSINYTSKNNLQKNSGAQVGGSITKTTPTAQHNQQAHHGLRGLWLVPGYLYITYIITAIVLVLLFPRPFEHAALAARVSLGKTLLVGLVASLVVPAILLVLAVTVVGLPLAVLAALAWLLMVLLAGPFAAYLLGRLILSHRTNAILVMLVGAAILFLLYLLPVVGFPLWVVGTWFGLGTLLLQAHHLGRPHYSLPGQEVAGGR